MFVASPELCQQVFAGEGKWVLILKQCRVREKFFLEISISAHSKVPCSPGARTMDYLSRQKRGCQGTFLYGRGRLVRKTDRNYGPIIFKIDTKYFQIS